MPLLVNIAPNFHDTVIRLFVSLAFGTTLQRVRCDLFNRGMSTVEELHLLQEQVQDVARVCNAVARGDLSQKTIQVVMVQLKYVINTIVRLVFSLLLFSVPTALSQVDKLGQFAKEVTRVSQEVGPEGYPYLLASFNVATRLTCGQKT